MSPEGSTDIESLSGIEKELSHHQHNDAQSISEHDEYSSRARPSFEVTDSKGHNLKNGAPSSQVNHSDWTGPNDPENPHNCMK
jgi:hypothetical protein